MHALEDWVEAWREQKDSDVIRKGKAHSDQKKHRWGKGKSKGENDSDDALLEGIIAWINGWKDVEEDFRIRSQRRTLRRERNRTMNG